MARSSRQLTHLTSEPMTRPRALGQLLVHGAAARLMERVQLLNSLTVQLRRCLDGELAAHVQVADLGAERLFLQADSAAWATRLRYLAPQLLHCLQQSGLGTLRQIEIRVAPRAETVTPMRDTPVLSATSAAIIAHSAATLPDPALRAAFQRLARRGNGKKTDS